MAIDAVVAEARRWLGTPYHHGASLRGVGCDCLGLVVGVRRACFGIETPVPVYPPDWAEAFKRELLAQACATELVAAPDADADEPGAVLLLRWRLGRPASHLAIATGGGAMVHAHAGAGVVETGLGPAWRLRLAGTFRFAEI